jgi:sulfur relay protein TusB/DsrH
MGTLYCIKRSAFESRLPSLYFQLAKEGDSIFFCQDGVFSLGAKLDQFQEELEAKRQEGVQFYAMEDDIKMRAVKCPEHIQQIDYDGFVGLLEEHQRIIS